MAGKHDFRANHHDPTMHFHTDVSFAALASILLGSLPAQAPSTLALPVGDVPLITFIDRCAVALGKNVQLPPGGTADAVVKLERPVEITRAGGLHTLAEVLFANGHVLCWANEAIGLLELIPVDPEKGFNVRKHAVRRQVEQVLAEPDLLVPVTTAMEVRRGSSMLALQHLARLARGSSPKRCLFVSESGPDRLTVIGLQRDVAWAITSMQSTVHAAATLSLPAGEMPLTAFVDACAAILGAHVALPPLAGAVPSVRLQSAVNLGSDGCMQLLAAQLHRAGFGLFWANEGERRLGVLRLDESDARAWFQHATKRQPQEVLLESPLLMPVTTTVELARLEASIACSKLRCAFAEAPPASYCPPQFQMSGEHKLVITGLQRDVALALAFVGTCDEVEPQFDK